MAPGESLNLSSCRMDARQAVLVCPKSSRASCAAMIWSWCWLERGSMVSMLERGCNWGVCVVLACRLEMRWRMVCRELRRGVVSPLLSWCFIV